MRTRTIILMAALVLATGSTGVATAGGVQWSPDGKRLFVNSDVGPERWAITLNLQDVTVTGNVFFAEGPEAGRVAFIWCDRLSHNHEPSIGELTLRYRCFGSDGAGGGFDARDWNLISDQVFLNATFFAPTPETCDLQGALNGPNAQSATSFWDCSGTSSSYQFQAFGDGTGFSTAIGPFELSLVENGCGFGQLSDGSFFNAEFSPSRDLLTLYQTPPAVDRFILSECHRVGLF